MTKRIIQTSNAPAAVGAYSQAVAASGLVFVSGQLGLDPASGKFVPGDVAAQAKQALENLNAILTAAGTSMENVVKTTVLLADIEDFKTVNGVYAGYFEQNPPARAAYSAAGLPLGALVEIEAIATVE